MNQKYKLKMWLSLIPFFGFFVVVIMGFVDIKKSKHLMYSILYVFLSMLPMFVLVGVGSLIGNYIIMPLDTVWVVVLISLVMSYILLVCAAFIAIAILYGFMKQEDNSTSN